MTVKSHDFGSFRSLLKTQLLAGPPARSQGNKEQGSVKELKIWGAHYLLSQHFLCPASAPLAGDLTLSNFLTILPPSHPNCLPVQFALTFFVK